MVSVEEFLTIVLVLVAVKIVFNFSRFFYTSIVGAVLGHNIDLSQHGPWAGNQVTFPPFLIYDGHSLNFTIMCKQVVTGATDGIGKVYARRVFRAFLLFSNTN